MYNGIGLTTPRGSGTSGYVQRNLSALRSYQRDQQDHSSWDAAPPKHREPDQGILEHERKRAVEVKCMELQDKLEEAGVGEEEIEKQVSILREKLLANLNSTFKNPRQLKPSDTHAIAAAKKVELERMARALGTRSDYQEGDSFDREKQEEMRLKNIAEREERDKRRLEDRKNMDEQRKKWAEEKKKRDDDSRRRDFDRPKESGGRDMPPPSIPTGPRRGDGRSNMGPPPPPRDRRERSPPPRSRDVEMRSRDDRSRSPPIRTRKRSPSRSPSRSRSPRYSSKRPARDRSMSPPRRSRPPVRRRRSPLGSRSPRSRSRSYSRSPSPPRSPARRYRRSGSPPPSAARKPRSPLPTPAYTRDEGPRGGRGYRDREVPPHLRRGSPPPRSGGDSRPLDHGRDKSPPLRRPSPGRGRTPEKKERSRSRGRSASTGSSMSVSTGSRSGSPE